MALEKIDPKNYSTALKLGYPGVPNFTDPPYYEKILEWIEDEYNIYGVLTPRLGSKNGYDSFPLLGWRLECLYSLEVENKNYNSFYLGYNILEYVEFTKEDLKENLEWAFTDAKHRETLLKEAERGNYFNIKDPLYVSKDEALKIGVNAIL
jgi:hypothetical protein